METLLEPFILPFQMLERSIENIIVRGDLLDLSGKGKENLYPLSIVVR